MKKLKYFVIAFLLAGTFIACKKEAGEGGKASITGAIRVKKYNSSGTVIAGEYEGAYEDVYIIYGDNSTYGNRIQANPQGKYEFKYLQPGHYKVYAYSKDSTGNSSAPKFALVHEVEISSRKQTVDAGTITVYAY
ncbi:MAG: hypothetical protein ACJ77K_15660 [Bacteroidia bacterium]